MGAQPYNICSNDTLLRTGDDVHIYNYSDINTWICAG